MLFKPLIVAAGVDEVNHYERTAKEDSRDKRKCENCHYHTYLHTLSIA